MENNSGIFPVSCGHRSAKKEKKGPANAKKKFKNVWKILFVFEYAILLLFWLYF